MDMSTLFALKGRSALITGGSRGIGRMIAEGLVQSGVRVYITARKAEACDATAAELSEQGTCVSLPGDISTKEGLASVVARLREHETNLDILVNNAGAAWGAPFDEFPESGWDKVMDLNVKAPFFLTQAAKPLLLAGRERVERPAGLGASRVEASRAAQMADDGSRRRVVEGARTAGDVAHVGGVLERRPDVGARALGDVGIEVAAVRVWHEVRERALEVGRVAQELATHARNWLGRVAERTLEALEPAPDAWGDFFAEAAQGGLRDDLSRDLDRDRQVAEQAERARQLELVKEREAHARRDDELDHGL